MRKEPNYLYLMTSLLVTVMLITAARPRSLLGLAGVVTGLVSLMMAASYVMAGKRGQMLVAVLLAAAAFLPFVCLNFYPEAVSPKLALSIYTVTLTFWLVLTVYVGVIVLRTIVAARRIGSNEIYGAIYLYLVIGVLFAEVYQMLLVWQPDALFFDPARFPPPEAPTLLPLTRGTGDILYYSFVTLGTVGYGDVTPATPIARALSLVEMLTGIMYVATMISRFVSIETSTRANNHD